MKFIFVMAAVLAADPATPDLSLGAVPMFFESVASCEVVKPTSRPRLATEMRDALMPAKRQANRRVLSA
jgi:hypothetical protein